MGRVEVLTGPEWRCRWTVDQKRAIVAAAFAPGAVVSAVGRRADVCAGQIYRWRREIGTEPPDFAEVTMVPAPAPPMVPGDAGIEVRLADGAHVFIPATTMPGLAAAVIRAVAGR